MVGTGFLAKAMLVLVTTGALATGVGGDKMDPATASAKPAARVSVAPSQSVGSGLVAGSVPSSFTAQLAAAPDVRGAAGATAKGNEPAAVISFGTALPGIVPTAAATSSSPPPATAPVAAAVSSVVSTAEEAAPPAAVSLPVPAPSLPVPSLPVPSLPEIPIEVPEPPPLP
jgi:hypothetical protein